MATVYTAWERADPQPDGGRYRRLDGQSYRQIGSALQDPDRYEDIEEMEGAYARQYQRAYRLIYRAFPDLTGQGEELDGEVIIR